MLDARTSAQSGEPPLHFLSFLILIRILSKSVDAQANIGQARNRVALTLLLYLA